MAAKDVEIGLHCAATAGIAGDLEGGHESPLVLRVVVAQTGVQDVAAAYVPSDKVDVLVAHFAEGGV